MEQLLQHLGFSFWQSISTVIISLIIGAGLAYWEDAKKILPQKWFSAIMALPVFLPGLIVATGFIAVWGNNGYVNNLFSLFNIPKVQWLYSPWAIIASHVYYNFPLFYLAVSSRLQAKDKNINDIAAVLGANNRKIFSAVSWPRAKSAVVGAGLLVFLYSFLSFALPLVLGGIRYQTLEVYIYNLATRQFDLKTALLMSVLQFILLLLPIIFFSRHLFSMEEKKISFFSSADVKKSRAISLIKVILAAYVLLPLTAIFIKSWPLINYYKLFKNTDFFVCLGRSALIAVITIICGLIVNLCVLLMNKKKLSRWLIILLAFSPASLGVLLRLYFPQTAWLLVIAYIFMLWPINYYLLSSAWLSKPKYFSETLLILGANKIQHFFAAATYLLPAVKKVIILNVVYVLGDLAMASILLPYGKKTAMALAYSLLGSYRFSLASAGLSSILLTIILLTAIIYFYDFKSRKFKR